MNSMKFYWTTESFDTLLFCKKNESASVAGSSEQHEKVSTVETDFRMNFFLSVRALCESHSAIENVSGTHSNCESTQYSKSSISQY